MKNKMEVKKFISQNERRGKTQKERKKSKEERGEEGKINSYFRCNDEFKEKQDAREPGGQTAGCASNHSIPNDGNRECFNEYGFAKRTEIRFQVYGREA